MTTTYHSPITAGATNAPSTINTPLAALDSAIVNIGASGGTFVTANGAANAAQKVVTVDSSTGLVAGANVSYTLVGGVIEANTIDTVDSATQITLTTNIGTGGIADNGVIAQVTPDAAAIATSIKTDQTLTAAQAVQYSAMAWFNVRAYGAVGDGSTDDTAAIQAALDAAAADGVSGAEGGVCYVPPGDYKITSELNVPKRVALIGAGHGGSSITADSAFDFSTYSAMIRLGRDNDAAGSGQYDGGCLVRDLLIDANNVTNSVCVYSDAVNENGGLIRVRMIGWVSKGAVFNTGSTQKYALNFSLHDIYLVAGAGAGASSIGVDITGNGGIRGIRGCTVDIAGVTNILAGIELNNCGGGYSEIHVEDATHGIRIGNTTACNGVNVTGFIGAATLTNCVTIANTAGNRGIICAGINQNGSTNTILDSQNSNTITAPVGIYNLGPGTGSGARSVMTDSSGAMSIFRHTVGLYNIRANAAGGANEVTIASSAVTIDRLWHKVDTESDAASDDLWYVWGGAIGQFLILQAVDSARTVVCKDGTGNLQLAGDFDLDNTRDRLMLMHDGSNWIELSRSNNTA